MPGSHQRNHSGLIERNGWLRHTGIFNQRFFESALSRPAITIQSIPGAHGHFTPYDAWDDSDRKLKEINLGAESLHRPVPNIIATLMHEMVHYWCHSQGIKDTSRGNTYHNKRFKEEAEKRGLIISSAPPLLDTALRFQALNL